MTATTLAAARHHIEAVLLEHGLPGWDIITDERNLDTLERTTVLVSITNVARQAEAPMGAWDTTCTVTIASPKFDNLPAAETDLEADLGELLALIEDHLGTAWQPATKALFRSRYLAWDVPINLSTSRID